MRTNISKFAKMAALGLALSFTFTGCAHHWGEQIGTVYQIGGPVKEVEVLGMVHVKCMEGEPVYQALMRAAEAKGGNGIANVVIDKEHTRIKSGPIWWSSSNVKYGSALAIKYSNYCGRVKLGNYDDSDYFENYLNIPLMFQYVSFFYPTTDIQVHWVPSPKRHVFMHLKTIKEAGAFIDIPLGTEIDNRNFFDLGGMVGYAAQLENIIFGLRLAASYTNIGDFSLLVQLKAYFGYLF